MHISLFPISPDIQPYLIIALPILLPLFGSSVAALLQQTGFPPWLNDIIGFFALLLAAGVSAYVAGQLSGDTSGIISAIVGAMTLLIQGSLHNLSPYVKYLNLLQALSVVKPKPKPVTSITEQPTAVIPAIPSGGGIPILPTQPMPVVRPIDYSQFQVPGV